MFKTRQITTQTLGEKLKNARESVKMTLEQASKKTGIPLYFLQRLEEGAYNRLPANVYIAAYLKKYSKILNLNIDETLNQFTAEKGAIADFKEPKNLNQKSRYFAKEPIIVNPKRVGLVLCLIITALIFGYFWHQLSFLINPPSIKISQPVSDLTTKERTIEVLGQTDLDVYLTINGREVYVDEKGFFRSVLSLEQGINLLKIEAKDRFGKTNTATRRIMVTK